MTATIDLKLFVNLTDAQTFSPRGTKMKFIWEQALVFLMHK